MKTVCCIGAVSRSEMRIRMAFIKKKELREMEKREEKLERELEKSRRKGSGSTGYVIAAECIFLLIGAVLLFVPKIQIIHICYGLSGVLVFVGIIQIVHYFLTESYRNMNEYGFAIGVLGVILGMCALVRVQAIADSFLLVLGIFLLLTAIIKLQYAMDLKSMKDPMWVVAIILAVLLIAGAVCVIINPFQNMELHKLVTYNLLLVDGSLGIISNIYLFIRVKLYDRKERKRKEQMENGIPVPQQEQPDEKEPYMTDDSQKRDENEADYESSVSASSIATSSPKGETTVHMTEQSTSAVNEVEEWLSGIPEAEQTEGNNR